MNSLTLIGQNIKKYRELKLIKQESLAKHLGITKGRMSQIENGLCAELTLSRLQKIADYLNVDLAVLLVTPNVDKGQQILLTRAQLKELVNELVLTINK